ncbi:MAG TPA: MFS transporter [Xanthobacteraceae bacterium]|nr:MFS transporter [Xanthobacteraceae bacterium]
MSALQTVLFGPWRAVLVLGVTQILAWGAIYYPPVLTLPLIAADRGWSVTLTMGGLSFGLLIAGLASPRIGALIDRHGGHRVMPGGSLVGAAGLVGLVYADNPVAYFACWMALGLAMSASLYDPAFATLGRVFGAAARRPITALTLAGGFASTVSWPATHVLIDAGGWRGTYLVYAVLLAFVAAPLHAFALPRGTARPDVPASGAAPAAPLLPARGVTFALVTAAFAAYAFVPSGLAAHMLAIFGRLGLDAGTVVMIGTLFGPAQVTARLFEFALIRNLHPLWLVRFAVGLLLVGFVLLATFGLSVAVAATFAILFGGANGLITIARGTVPLALFGAAGYGRIVGRIAGPALITQSAAPLLLAYVIEHASDPAALAVTAAFALVALACFVLVRRPRSA